MKLKLHKINKIYFLFPLFILYLFVTIYTRSGISGLGDEPRYLMFAHNILNGFYSPEYPNINLYNGPGLPLILTPFLALHLSANIIVAILNPLFLFFAIVLLFKSFQLYFSTSRSLLFALLIGIYIPYLRWLSFVMTEPLSIFLISGTLFFTLKAGKLKKLKYDIIATLFLGYLTLTKVIFGYVIVTLLIIYLPFLISNFYRKQALRKIRLLVFSLLFCLPYLVYTYNLTGEIFYWSSSGGENLFWMSNPIDSEYGEWRSSEDIVKGIEHIDIVKNHRVFFQSINKLNTIERDAELKKIAAYNILTHPKAFINNWFANLSRMLFSFPFSYSYQKITPLLYVLPNMFIIVFSVFFVPLTLIKIFRKKYNPDILFFILFGIIFLSGMSLLGSTPRLVLVIMPIIQFWILYTIGQLIDVVREFVDFRVIHNKFLDR